MIRISAGMLLVGCTIFALGCGDEKRDDPLAGTQLVQDVRLIPYDLKKADWQINAETSAGRENLKKEVEFSEGPSKDQVARVFEDGRFFLVVNKVKAQIAIAPDGSMKYDQSVSKSLSGCSLSGSSKVEGKADHLRLNLLWDLSARMDGEGCPTELKAQFGEFIDAELARFNLSTATALIAALEAAKTEAKNLRLILKLEGAINPKNVSGTPAN